MLRLSIVQMMQPGAQATQILVLESSTKPETQELQSQVEHPLGHILTWPFIISIWQSALLLLFS